MRTDPDRHLLIQALEKIEQLVGASNVALSAGGFKLLAARPDILGEHKDLLLAKNHFYQLVLIDVVQTND
jgi:hypothetical protein